MQPSHQPKTARIAVIGAGASGLTAAHYLKQAGYANVIILEKAPCVGGKCCSVQVGPHVYEMGAVLGTRDYTTTLGLMRSVGLQAGPTDDSSCYDADGHRIDLFKWYQYPRLLRLLLVNYTWLTRIRYRRINAPGLAGIHPDLHQSFEVFAQHHGLPTLGRVLTPPFTAFGYGYFGEVPAAYVLKYLDLPTIEALRNGKRRLIWPDGIATLWSRLAQQHDVRTGVNIRRITRRDTVRVETDREAFEFDTLILTCPLDEALHFLDASPLECQLFSAIRHYDYWVLLCEINGLPPGSGYIPAHFVPEQAGHVLLWYHRWPDAPLYNLYVLGDFVMCEETIECHCAADLQRMGATLKRVVHLQRWKYFPHVSPADMAAGYYDALENLQGTHHTFYAGEVMSFATVEICARYAKALVARGFK